jgi:dTDP-4-amino-4,6-dideoxygalactose transaminase
MIGGFGLAEVFSFHATKFLNSFEGGAITTNDETLATKIRLMTNFGFYDYDKVIHLGTNGKMTEVCAAMGLTNFEGMEDLVAVNRRNYDAYRQGFANLPGLAVIDYPSQERNNFQYLVVEVDPDVSPLTRDEWVAVLHAEKVLARKYFWPGCHRMEPYRSLYPYAGHLLPETERMSARIMVLPTGTAMSVEDIGKVCGLICAASTQAPAIRKALAERLERV